MGAPYRSRRAGQLSTEPAAAPALARILVPLQQRVPSSRDTDHLDSPAAIGWCVRRRRTWSGGGSHARSVRVRHRLSRLWPSVQHHASATSALPPPPPTATCQCDEMILEVVGDDAGAAAARAFLAPLLGSYSMVANESASAHTVWHNPGAAFHGYLFLAVNAIWAIGPSFSAPAVWMENQVQGGPSTCPDESSGAQQWAFWNGMGWVAAPSVSVRAACPPPLPCISSYVSPSGLQLSSATSEYIQLPVILGLRSVSLWIYVEEVQDQYSWDYILDTRGRGHPEGWLAYNTFPSLRAGSAWRKMVIHDTGTGTRYAREVNDASDSLPLYIIPGGSWRHIYMESKAEYWGDDITVFGRYARGGGGDGREDCDGRFASIALWNRSLTDEEIDDLAAGGVGPSYGPGSPLVAHTIDGRSYRRRSSSS